MKYRFRNKHSHDRNWSDAIYAGTVVMAWRIHASRHNIPLSWKAAKADYWEVEKSK